MEKNQVVAVLEGLLEGLKKEGEISVLSEEYRKELEEKKERIEEEIQALRERLETKRQELKTIEYELNRDQSAQAKAIKQLATIAETLNIDLKALGIEVTLPEVKKSTSGSGGGKKSWARESRFYVDGKPVYYKPEQNTISRVLYYATKGFGEGLSKEEKKELGYNDNGSLSKQLFEKIATQQGFDINSGDDYEVTVYSYDRKEKVVISRIMPKEEKEEKKLPTGIDKFPTVAKK